MIGAVFGGNGHIRRLLAGDTAHHFGQVLTPLRHDGKIWRQHGLDARRNLNLLRNCRWNRSLLSSNVGDQQKKTSDEWKSQLHDPTFPADCIQLFGICFPVLDKRTIAHGLGFPTPLNDLSSEALPNFCKIASSRIGLIETSSTLNGILNYFRVTGDSECISPRGLPSTRARNLVREVTWTYSRHLEFVPLGSGDMAVGGERGPASILGKSARVSECVRRYR